MLRAVIFLTLAACGTGDQPAPNNNAEGLAAEGYTDAPTPEAVQAIKAAPMHAPEGWTHYGMAFTEAEPMPAADLLADPAAFDGKTVRVQGRVADVCQKKGCWMVIGDGEQTMRVMMKDHAFGVNMQGSGSDCQVEGLVKATEVKAEFVEHMKSESTGEGPLPEEQAQDGVTYQLIASGVLMKDLDS